MLIDTQIKDLVDNQQLIHPFEKTGLKYCRYNLRAWRVFSPVTGNEQKIDEKLPDGSSRAIWTISPTETLTIMTHEKVKIPHNIVGEYGQLFRLAQQGLLLINTSIVEPGYEGPLSCVVVNLSRETVTIKRDMEIAKLTFHQLSGNPGAPVLPFVNEEADYASTLSAAAVKLPKSFMGISQVSQEVSDKVNADVKKSVTFGGAVLIFLLVVASIQPWVTGLIYNRYPMSPDTVAQMKSQMDDVTSRLNAAESALKGGSDVSDLKRQVQLQAQEIKRLEANRPR